MKRRRPQAWRGLDDCAVIDCFLTTKIALQRYGTGEEVAQLALFLASDDASYCSGGIHMIDGGFTAG